MKTVEFIVVIVAQLSEYTKTTELHTSERRINVACEFYLNSVAAKKN